MIHEEYKAQYTQETMRQVFTEAWRKAEKAVADGMAGEICWTPKKDTRTLKMNAAMWAMLTDISRQVDWYGSKLQPVEWKDVFSAALKSQKTVPGIDGGFVVIGARTSRMSKEEMGNMLELMSAFASERDVKLTAPKWMYE